MDAEEGIEEYDYVAGGPETLAQVQDPPRTATASAVTALGVLVLGVGAASGWALFAGEQPLRGYASQAAGMGLSPGVLALSGVLLTALGAVGGSVLRGLKRTVDLLEVAPNPTSQLDNLEDSQQRLHVSLVATEANVKTGMHDSLAPLLQRLDRLELALSAASETLANDDGANDAIWRLAASMDQIRAQLDKRLAEQMANFENHMADELARATKEHASALANQLRGTEQRLASEYGQPSASTSVAPEPRVASAAPAELAAEPAAEPPGVLASERPAPAAPQVAKEPSQPQAMGLFDRIDDEGQPHASDQDLYAEPPPAMNVDEAPSIQPRTLAPRPSDETTLDR